MSTSDEIPEVLSEDATASNPKPNILECDGLIIRGPNGERRAQILVDEPDSGGGVEFGLFAPGMGDPSDDPALYAHVDGLGRSGLTVEYEQRNGSLPGISLESGDAKRRPSFNVRGRELMLPDRSADELVDAAALEISDTLRKYAAEHDLSPLDCRSVLELADTQVCEREEATS